MSKMQKKTGDGDWETVTVQSGSAVDRMFNIVRVAHVQVTYDDGTVEQWRKGETAEQVLEQVLHNRTHYRVDAAALVKALRDADLLKEDA